MTGIQYHEQRLLRVRKSILCPRCDFLHQLFSACNDWNIWTHQIRLDPHILRSLIGRMNSDKKLFVCHRPRTKLIENNGVQRLARKPKGNGGCLAQVKMLPFNLCSCSVLLFNGKRSTARMKKDER